MFVPSAKVFPTDNKSLRPNHGRISMHINTLYARTLTHFFILSHKKLLPMANSLNLCDYNAKIIAGNERWSKAIYVCVSKLIDYRWAHAKHTDTHTQRMFENFCCCFIAISKYYGAVYVCAKSHTITFNSNWFPLVYYCYQYVWDCCQLDWKCMCTCKWLDEVWVCAHTNMLSAFTLVRLVLSFSKALVDKIFNFRSWLFAAKWVSFLWKWPD